MGLPAHTPVGQEPTDVGLRVAPDIGPHRLFDSHLPFVWRNLRRFGVPDSLVEDAAQDVSLVVHPRWETWQVERSTVETWLFGSESAAVLGINSNTAYSRLRKARIAFRRSLAKARAADNDLDRRGPP